MNSTPKFLKGEQVERVMDGLVGTVVEISTYNGEFSYKVDLGREPMEGLTDDKWWGTGEAWRPILRTHAHVVTNSRDCDGDYERRYVDRPNALERTEEFGEHTFKERVMGSIVSLLAEEGILTVTPKGLHWSQPTNEGYVHIEVWWCEQDCDDKPTQRDFRAESMGY